MTTAGWLPEAQNGGWIYPDRVRPAEAGISVSAFYALRYRHSHAGLWRERLAAGEIARNGEVLQLDALLEAGDRLAWHRPSWREPAVPRLPAPLVDDGDLVVFNKPSGLPVLPAGGFLEHTVLRLLERWHRGDPAGVPRPVHRLGRFTSGLLLCARSTATRAWLSALMRDSTAALQGDATTEAPSESICRKLYRALLQPPVPGSPLDALPAGASLPITTPIGRVPHPRLGTLWCAAPEDPRALPACSRLTLLHCRPEGLLAAVEIASGRPHQIRIHTAASGAPLQGDPLYGPGGGARTDALPGDGGYRLHAHRLSLPLPDGGQLQLEAPLPPELRGSADG
jgi:23S rRNA pseudouridine1911/1915/1917 synthase